MDDKVTALLAALKRADDCRRTDPNKRICVPCWSDVGKAIKALDPPKELEILYG